uniref:Poly [ADP-ribose] polymerase n=1 Tax=Maylandia zebra TaxID=106582 RepID=A0A3P9AZZ9_9CICH
MSEKESECFFSVGSQKYKVDFTTMIQTNVATGFQRGVRSLVRLVVGSGLVSSCFHPLFTLLDSSMGSLQRIQIIILLELYMQKQRGKATGSLERHLFHGTTKEASEEICTSNFDPRVAGVNGVSHGHGTYFATAASHSHMFSAQFGPDEVCHMFLAKVLLTSRKKQHRLYDACVDNVNLPTMFVVFDSCQCYPYYLIKYKTYPKR